MEEKAFTPSVNWNKGHILDCLGQDQIVYGSKNNVVVITWDCDGYHSKVLYHAHDDKVIAVAAAPENVADSIKRTFATCSTDGFVKLWNIDKFSLVKAHQSHKPRKNVYGACDVVDFSWSRADPNLIVSLGSSSCIIAWHIAENVTYKFSLRNLNGRAIKCCPADASLVAVSDGGVINIIKILKNSTKMTKFRIFDQEIVDFAWQSDVSNPSIVFTSKRGDLVCLNTFEAKKCSKRIKLDFINQKAHDSTPFIFFPLLWLNSQTILTRSGNNLIALDFNREVIGEAEKSAADKDTHWRQNGDSEAAKGKNGCKTRNGEKNKSWRVLHSIHRRDFFVLSKSTQGDMVWTAGSDRTIAGYSLSTGEVERHVSTLFGGAICCAISPHDPNVVAFGGGDGCLRIWNVNHPTGKINTETRNVQDCVMGLCWHPEKENLLVFGTSTGRIGHYDAGKTKAATLLPPASCKPVYWLTWGPPFFPSTESPKFVLYVITNKNLFIYDDLESFHRPHPLGAELMLPSKALSDLAWKPDYSLLALGANNGDIYLMSPGCSVPAHIINIRYQVQYLSWHPIMTTTDSDLSPYHNLLSCGSVDPEGIIKVFQIEQNEVGVRSTVFATLSGHLDYVQSVAWSPHISGQLVSSSADFSIQIWDVLAKKPIANHQPTPGFLSLFAFWCPIHADYIISGSKEFSIHMWKISNKSAETPPVVIKKFGKKQIDPNDIAKEKGKDVEIQSAERLKRMAIQQETSLTTNAVMVNLRVPTIAGAVSGWTRNADSFGVCYQLLKADPADREALHCNCFFKSDENLSLKLVEQEKAQSSSKYDDSLSSLLLYQGRLKELIEKRIEDGNLTERLVSLAPSVSPRLWQEASAAYARQLRAKRRHLEAATYMLTCRNVKLAIETLVEGDLFLDALCVARAQLPKDDPSFNDVLRKYAKHLMEGGNFAKATECYIYLDDLAELEACLGRSCDEMAQCCLAYLAKKKGDMELRVQLALTALSSAIQNNRTHVFDTIAKDHQDLHVVDLVLKIHKTLSLPATPDSLPILTAVTKDMSAQDLKQCYSQMLTVLPNLSNSGVHNQLWSTIQELLLAASAPTDEIKRSRVLRALDIAQNQAPSELCSLCRHLSPSLTDEDGTGVFSADGPMGISLKGFLCLATMHQATANSDAPQTYLSRIVSLENYLLDELAFNYYRMKSQISDLQMFISNKSASSKDLEDLVDRRNQFVLDISKIEIARCVVPDPVSGFVLLRNYYTSLGEDNLAKNRVKFITQRYMPLLE